MNLCLKIKIGHMERCIWLKVSAKRLLFEMVLSLQVGYYIMVSQAWKKIMKISKYRQQEALRDRAEQ